MSFLNACASACECVGEVLFEWWLVELKIITDDNNTQQQQQ